MTTLENLRGMDSEGLLDSGLSVEQRMVQSQKEVRLKTPVVLVKAIITDNPVTITLSGDLVQMQKLHETGFRFEGRNLDQQILSKFALKRMLVSDDYLSLMMKVGLDFSISMSSSMSFFRFTTLFGTPELSLQLLRLVSNLRLEPDIAAWLTHTRSCCAEELLPLLLERHRVNPNVRYQGYTALGEAIVQQNAVLVQKLLSAGADPNQRSQYARPLKLAQQRESTAIIDLLIDAGSKTKGGSSHSGKSSNKFTNF